MDGLMSYLSLHRNRSYSSRCVEDCSDDRSAITIAPGGVYNRNLRDVPGLQIDGDGFNRGYVIIASDLELSGDYFQVDPIGNFASFGDVTAFPGP